MRFERQLALTVTLALAPVAGGCATVERFFSHGDGKVTETPAGRCLDLVPEYALHPVRACETAASYELLAGPRQLRLDKVRYQHELRERLLQFARRTAYPWRTLGQATIEVWMTAPLTEPEAASTVAVVKGPGGNFAVHLTLSPDGWQVVPENVVWLGKDGYPSLQAKRLGTVLVVPRGEVTEARLARFLAGVDAGAVPRDAWTPLELAVVPFAETAAARALMTRPGARAVLADVQLIPAGEREGAKAKAFEFAFASGAPAATH
jgi:hypothetical protein